MTRKEVIKKVAQLSGPLGPFESLDERTRQRNEWAAAGEDEVIDLLSDILVNPPDAAQFRQATSEDFELELSELLILLGQHDPTQLIQKIGPLLTNGRARPTIIGVIGALGVEDGIRWLTPLVESAQLTGDELVRLAGALGEIGGPAARLLLEQMRASTPAGMTDVLQEINIALQSK
jgi:hypothetical protein